MKKHLLLTIIAAFAFLIRLSGQPVTTAQTLRWTDVQTVHMGNHDLKVLNFVNAVNHDKYGLLPVYSHTLPLDTPGIVYRYSLNNMRFVPFANQDEILQAADHNLIGSRVELMTTTISIRGRQYSQLQFLPVRHNAETGLYEKLVSFTIEATPVPGNTRAGRSKGEYASTSVLATGDWFKIGITKNGVYKLTYADLESMGMDVASVNPDNLKVFGNGGGMLPESNKEFRHDDLQENPIFVSDGGDGSFDPGDYLLFYGQGPNEWEYVPLKLAFTFIKNRYTDVNHYFVTAGPGAGKRIQTEAQYPQAATDTVTTFNSYAVHELDAVNLIRSGAEWYGEEFSDVLHYDFDFEFPHRDVTDNVYMVFDFATRADKLSHLQIDANGDSLMNIAANAIPPGSITQFGASVNKTKRLKLSGAESITIGITYDKPSDQSKAWLNFIEINAVSHLTFDGRQFLFRNIATAHPGRSTEFMISGANENFRVWDVTDPVAPHAIATGLNGSSAHFRLATDTLREFIGFGSENFPQPELMGRMENQDLHAIGSKDFIIIVHPDFLEQAERLKQFHATHDQLDICIVTPAQIFNEFSSGNLDPVAIRSFVRMVYERSGTPPALKYLLLFGDGSYDPKNRLVEGANFIPTFQSRQSLWYTTSYVSDDFYGLMDEDEGLDAAGNVDIGIGRLPVDTPEEAEAMVDKIERYMLNSPEVQGEWRNTMCFVADDEDYNLHIFQADTVLVKGVERRNETININKIYFDAYPQETSSSGNSYPEVTKAFNAQMQKGALVMNYTGHGGELGLAHEHVVQIADINSWDNYYKLPVFITATCEFSPYDNPLMTSAGELVLLNPNGGGIALFTTTRLAFASSNLTLNKRIYDTLFRSQPGSYPRLGDLVMFSKNPSNTNIRNFTLLGDPALQMALPQHGIALDSINGQPAGTYKDTLRANSRVNLSGHVSGFEETGKSILDSFNGIVYISLFDKPDEITTLANDPRSMPYKFKLQDKVLVKGKATVDSGRFRFSFVIPKDISYEYGPGKLSFYASDSLVDAGGAFENLMIGGYDDHAAADNSGPQIDLFLNDSTFVNTSLISNNPVMLANISDPSGINATGTGIGHDIVATLDGNLGQAIILNDHFEPVVDDFSSGSIIYPVGRLTQGRHTLQLKAWDMYNNSSVKTIEFFISDSLPVNLLQVYNYPNPFSDRTWFTFRHNQFEEDLTVEIQIFNFNGQLVRTIGPQKVFTAGYNIQPIEWDGTTAGGEKLRPGWYVYKVNVYNAIGLKTQMVQKMIISN